MREQEGKIDGICDEEEQLKDYWRLKNFRNYDWLTVWYLAIWIILLILFRNKIPYFKLFLTLHILSGGISFLLGGFQPESAPLKFLRVWYPLFFLPLFFTALHYLIPAIHPRTIDLDLIKMDILLFGTNPTVWLEKLYHPLLTDILLACYSIFYFLPLIILIPLYYRGERKNFERVAFGFLLAFYLSYFGYLLFPALGPRFYLAHLHQTSLRGYIIFHYLSKTLNGLENIQWDAFPSGHVAVAMVYLYFARQFLKRVFIWTLPLVLLLVFSTVYLRYHYFVDVLSGLVLFGIVFLIDRRIYSLQTPDR